MKTLNIKPDKALSNRTPALAVALFAGLALCFPTLAEAAGDGSVQITGTFTVIHADGPSKEGTMYFLDRGQTHYRLHFGHRPTLEPSQLVTLKGTLSGHDLSVSGIIAAGRVVSATTTGTHSVLVMMVHYSPIDNVTPSQAETQIGATDDSWYQGTSYGQLGLTATATPWMDIPDSSSGGTTCDLYRLWVDAETAAISQGYVPSNYDHEMIYVPSGTPGCNVWAGQAQVNGRISWIYGYMDTRVTVHELGHNLSLWHSHSLTCHGEGDTYTTLSDNCEPYVEYGDWWDAMGCCFSTPGQFNALQKDNLGWMSGRIATYTSGNRNYFLSPLESVSGRVQALKLNTSGHTYWLDYRQPIGEDAYLSPFTGVTGGVEIHIPEPSDGTNGTDLLDGSPDSNFGSEVLAVGDSWTTPEGVTITVKSATPRSAHVSVKRAPR
jgi:Gametolysin peptidase M11